MKNRNRVPVCKDFTPDGMLNWFAEMSAREMIFHPDDDPADLVQIARNVPMFSVSEACQLRETIDRMFAEHGENVYEAAYSIFMRRINIQPDA